MHLYRKVFAPKLIFGLASLSCIFATPASALEYFGSLSLTETYSDNVLLAGDGFEESEWVTGILPTIGAAHEGQRIEFELEYGAEAYFYQDVSDRNEVYSEAYGFGTLDVIGENLRLFGEAILEQVNVDPADPLAASNINVTGNRTEQLTWEAGPQWGTNIFRDSQIDAFLYGGNVDFDDQTLQDVDSIRGQFHVGSQGETVSPLSYLLAYNYRQYDYDRIGAPSEDSKVEDQNAYLSMEYQFGPEFRLLGLVGLDNDLSDPTKSGLDDGRWEAGFGTSIGSSLIEAAVGHRYFGTTYRFSWDVELEDRVFRFSYTERPGTTETLYLDRRQQPGIPDDLLEDTTFENETPESIIDRPGTIDRSVQKRADALMFLRTYKGALSVRAWWEEREKFTLSEIDPDLTTQNEDEKGYGINARWGWELGERTIARIYGSWRRSDLLRQSAVGGDGVTTSESDLYRAEFGIDNQLGQYTLLTFELSYQSREPGTGSLASEYDEIIGFLGVTRAF